MSQFCHSIIRAVRGNTGPSSPVISVIPADVPVGPSVHGPILGVN